MNKEMNQRNDLPNLDGLRIDRLAPLVHDMTRYGLLHNSDSRFLKTLA